MENPKTLARSRIESAHVAFFVFPALRRAARQVSCAHNDRVSSHDRRGVQTDLAGNEIHFLVIIQFEIDDTVFSKTRHRPADLGVECDHLITRCDVDDAFGFAIGPVRQTAAGELPRRGFAPLSFV
jgi:hypothetical protein